MGRWTACSLGVLALGLTVAGCNTVGGMGEDVAAVGNWVSGTAEDVRKPESQQAQAEQRRERQQRAEARQEREREQRQQRAEATAAPSSS